jgi:signal transduction histidine kinase
MTKQKQLVNVFLLKKKEEFLERWQTAVEETLPPFLKTGYVFTREDFKNLFDAYLANGTPLHSLPAPAAVIAIIKQKISQGFPLSMIGILNACFMATAREIIRTVYPDSFDARMEYLEELSQRVLDNEIVLSRHYENYVHDLNSRLADQAAEQERRHASLLEFIDCSTRELQSPLWSILGFTAKLQRKYYSLLREDGKHCLNRIAANVAEMHQLITDMTNMLLIEEEPMEKEEIPLEELVEACCAQIQTEVDNKFSVMHDTRAVTLIGDRVHLATLFYHLFKNAAQFTKGDAPGRAHIRWEKKEDPAGEFHLYVEDEGMGVTPDYRELVFKPLERLKEKDTEGSGLGLAFVRRIVGAHKGSISLEDARTGGICAHIIFPLAMIAIKE